MELLFFTESRLNQTEGNRFYSIDQSFSHKMFRPYLKVFDRIMIVARSKAVKKIAIDEDTRVDHSGVNVLPLPYYVGPYRYLVKKIELERILRNYIDSYPDSAIICRVPGIIGTTVAKFLIQQKKCYGLVVVGDPHDVFARGAFHHFFRPIFRYIGIKNLERAVKEASAVLYVTKQFLQARFPPPKHAFSTFASNVWLPKEAFVSQAKKLRIKPRYSIVTIGTLATMYKSPDIAIEALSILKKRGLSVTLQWLGDGKYRSKMIEMTIQNSVSNAVTFVGNVSSTVAVRSYLDGADLFVLPSRTEGLPRALLEAMARGLPCIATDIGGIPELLDKEALVPINNPSFLADTITHFLTLPGLADRLAEQNLITSANFKLEKTEPKLVAFLQYLKRIS